jgi:hypothetical protein
LATVVHGELHSYLGWRPNDLFLSGPTIADNHSNRQIGIILGVRDAIRVLKQEIGRTDLDLAAAEADFMTDPRQRGALSAEGKYEDGIVRLRRFMRRSGLSVVGSGASSDRKRFFDSWGRFLDRASAALPEVVNDSKRNSQWAYQASVDDDFYLAQGYAFVLYCLTERIADTARDNPEVPSEVAAVRVDLAALREVVTTKPLIVLTDSGRKSIENELHALGILVVRSLHSAV